MPDDPRSLPLFSGPHVPLVRYAAALERLDLVGALADCPPEERSGLVALTSARTIEALLAIEPPSPGLERAWNRIIGRKLDRPVPGEAGGDIAAAWLSRGGDAGAEGAARRHLARRPADWRGWQVLLGSQPQEAAIRCAFHGGPSHAAVEPLLLAIEEDGLTSPERWLPAYGWILGVVGNDEVAAALAAEDRTDRPLQVPGDGVAFAWYLLEAEGFRFGREHPDGGVVESRRRLRAISAVAFARYLARVAR